MKTKKLLIIILTALLSFNGGYFLSQSTLYPETGIVTEVDKTETNTYKIVFDTSNGHEWVFYTEDPDWFVGDVVSTIMCNKCTEDITDDSIIDVRYSGTIDMYRLEN